MLPKSFFDQDSLSLAKSLLGCELVHITPEDTTSGIIVETESYSQDDAASHSYRGETERTRVMFGSGGHAYVYFTYGMHYCFNVTADKAGVGSAVLIRALDPKTGIEIMKKRRGRENVVDLASGPAKLVQAMGITKADYGKPLFSGNLFIRSHLKNPVIESGPRVGIKQATDKPWRFWVSGSTYVSR